MDKDWWLDLLTTYTRDSYAITALLLISIIQKSPQHAVRFFQPGVFTGRSPATATSPAVSRQRLLTMEILQLQELRFYLRSLPCRTQLSTDLVAIVPFSITPRSGTHRQHPVASGMCLPSRYLETGCKTQLFHCWCVYYFCVSTVLAWGKYAKYIQRIMNSKGCGKRRPCPRLWYY
jgi:hypothetical protein